MTQPVIVEAVRTPIGKRRGALSGVHPANLLGAAQLELIKRTGVDPAEVEQIFGGCVTQAGEQ
jgi:acetyl-CoA C-acetyltransferase